MIEIEVDGEGAGLNLDLLFEPTGTRVRGAFKPGRHRLREAAGKVAIALPDGVPGQRIQLDADKAEGVILEPLADPSHARTRAELAKLATGKDDAKPDVLIFDPSVRIFPGVHVPTWLAYMVRAVNAGYARVTKGTLPKDPPADAKPRVFSSLSRPKDEPKPASVTDILSALGKLSAAEKRELMTALGGK